MQAGDYQLDPSGRAILTEQGLERFGLEPGSAWQWSPARGLEKLASAPDPEGVSAAQEKERLAADAAIEAVDYYIEKLDELGGGEVLPSTQKAVLMSRYDNAITKLNAAAGLGALSGPDEAILRNVLSEPNTWRAAAQGALGFETPAQATARSQLAQLKAQRARLYGQAPPAASGTGPPGLPSLDEIKAERARRAAGGAP